MVRHSVFRAGLLIAIAGSLSGCVAAAIPVLAGGLMVGGGGDDTAKEADRSGSAKVDAPVESISEQPLPQPASSPATVAELAPVTIDPNEDLPGRTAIAIDEAAQGASPAAAESQPVRATAVAIPETPAAGSRDPLSLRAYDAFYSYVDAQARRDPVERPRDSAMLTSPGL